MKRRSASGRTSFASGRTSLRGFKKKCVNQVGKGPQGYTVLKGVSQGKGSTVLKGVTQ
jgi:hypothetical protein